MKKLWVLLFLISVSSFCHGQITVTTIVEHVKVDGIDSKGALFVNVSGGNSPYTFSWSPSGLTSKDFTNAPIGTHTLVITDNSSVTVTKVYNVGYKTDWNYFFGSVNLNDSLYSDGSSGTYNQTAVSNNILRPSLDGFIELIVRQENYPCLIGFTSEQNPIAEEDFSDIIYSFHISTYGDLYLYNGSYFNYLGSTGVDDVLRIERLNGQFRLLKNEIVIDYIDAIDGELRTKGLISSSALVDVGLSFADSTTTNPLRVHANINHAKYNNTDTLGSIDYYISGGASPYTYSWTPTLSGYNVIDSVSKGTYTLTVSDYNNNQIERVYKLGYNTDWSYFFGSVNVNDSLYSDGSSGTYNQTSTSNNILRANKNGYIQLVVQNANMPCLLGFTPETNPISEEDFWDVNFGFHISTTGVLYFFNGSYFIYLGTTELGDVLEVERLASNYYLKKNNSIIYNSTGTTNELRTKGLISTSALVDVGLNFADSTSNVPFHVIAIVDHMTTYGIDTLGKIKLKVVGGGSPYTYTWTPTNSHTKDISNLSKGSYTLVAKDYFGNQYTGIYNIGYKTNWNNFYATELRNDSLIYNNYVLPADSFPTARVNDTLSSDSSGWTEVVIGPFVAPYVMGYVSQVNPDYNGSIYDIDFGMHITYDNELYVWEYGNWIYIGKADEGDRVQIGVDRGVSSFDLFWNGRKYYSSFAGNTDLQLKVQIVGPPYAPVWPAIVNVGNSYPAMCKNPPIITLPNGSSVINQFTQSTNLLCSISGGFGNKTIQWNPNMYFQSPYTNSQSNTYVVPPTTTHYTATVTDAKGCKTSGYVSVFVIPQSYAVLKREYDGGYYKIINNQVYFKYDGEYNSGTLTYTIYNNQTNQAVVSGPLLNKVYGDNRFSINATMWQSGFYRLEVVNEKNELFVLKLFK